MMNAEVCVRHLQVDRSGGDPRDFRIAISLSISLHG